VGGGIETQGRSKPKVVELGRHSPSPIPAAAAAAAATPNGPSGDKLLQVGFQDAHTANIKKEIGHVHGDPVSGFVLEGAPTDAVVPLKEADVKPVECLLFVSLEASGGVELSQGVKLQNQLLVVGGEPVVLLRVRFRQQDEVQNVLSTRNPGHGGVAQGVLNPLLEDPDLGVGQQVPAFLGELAKAGINGSLILINTPASQEIDLENGRQRKTG